MIAGEVLAVSFAPGDGPGDWPAYADPDLGLHFWLTQATN